MAKNWTETRYNQELKREIEETFVHFVDAEDFLDVMRKYGLIVSSSKEEEVRAVYKGKGKTSGARLLLDRICVKDDWFNLTVKVLKDEDMKQRLTAGQLTKIKENLDKRCTVVNRQADYSNTCGEVPFCGSEDGPASPNNDPTRPTSDFELEASEGSAFEDDACPMEIEEENVGEAQGAVGPQLSSEVLNIHPRYTKRDPNSTGAPPLPPQKSSAIKSEGLATVSTNRNHSRRSAGDGNVPQSPAGSSNDRDLHSDADTEPRNSEQTGTQAYGMGAQAAEAEQDDEVEKVDEPKPVPEEENLQHLRADLEQATINQYDEIDNRDQEGYEQPMSVSQPAATGGSNNSTPGVVCFIKQKNRGMPPLDHGPAYDFSFDETRNLLGNTAGWQELDTDQQVVDKMQNFKHEDGHYIFWYWKKMQRPAICVTCQDKVYTFLIHKKPDRSTGQIQNYFVYKHQKRDPSLRNVINYHLEKGIVEEGNPAKPTIWLKHPVE